MENKKKICDLEIKKNKEKTCQCGNLKKNVNLYFKKENKAYNYAFIVCKSLVDRHTKYNSMFYIIILSKSYDFTFISIICFA